MANVIANKKKNVITKKPQEQFTPLYGGSLLKGRQVGKQPTSFGKGFGGEPITKKKKTGKEMLGVAIKKIWK